MKTRVSSPRKSASGYALTIVLVFGAVSAAVLGSAMTRTINTGNLNGRNNQYTVNLSAAEAATEKVVSRLMVDYKVGGNALVTNNMTAYRTMVPTSSDSAYWNDFQFSDGLGNAGRMYVNCVSNQVYVPLQSQFYGLNGFQTIYRVLANARATTGSYQTVTNAVQQDVGLYLIPAFQFAIFYNSLLEFTWAAPLTVRGRAHANGHIFLGSSAALTFDTTVTATGTIQKKAWGGHSLSDYSGSITYKGKPDYRTNVAQLSLPIGTNNTPDAVREIINVPPSGESVSSSMGQERFYNKAGMILLVSNVLSSNTVITAVIKNAPGDAAPSILRWTNTPPYFMTNTVVFKDQRENDWMKTTDIDMGKLRIWIRTNTAVAAKHPSGNPLNIMYVGDFRPTNSTTNTAVRLVNGRVLPESPAANGAPTGFTVATPNPLYVKGHYNCTNDSLLNTTNTSATVPAALVSDALTILSGNWDDSKSSDTFKNRTAVSTTVNAALIAGVVYSQGSTGNSPFSGGVVNYPRLLEDWGNGSASVVLTLNTSLVSFFNSVKAVAPFQNPGVYYYAPTRQFNFDNNFTNPSRLPPGTPMFSTLLRAAWGNPPPDTVNYAASYH